MIVVRIGFIVKWICMYFKEVNNLVNIVKLYLIVVNLNYFFKKLEIDGKFF